MIDRPDPTTTDIVTLCRYIAQNEEMVDNRFTYVGALLMRAADEIISLRAAQAGRRK